MGRTGDMEKIRTCLIFSIVIFFVVMAAFTLGTNIRLALGNETIYIQADGSINPPTAPITSLDNITYIFTDNINDSIVVERENIIINGNGYSLQGAGNVSGFYLFGIDNVTIENVQIEGFYTGVFIESSSYNTIHGNDIRISEQALAAVYLKSSNNSVISGNNITKDLFFAMCSSGVLLDDSSTENTICENNISERFNDGIRVQSASNNTLWGNIVTDNRAGVGLYHSSYNNISRNKVEDNRYGVILEASSFNTISENNITDNDYYGVAISLDKPLGPSSNENTITRNNISRSGKDGVWIQGASRNRLTRNNIAYSGEYGVNLTIFRWEFHHFEPTHNNISENNVFGNKGGIYVTDGSSYNTISGNNITNNQWRGGIRLIGTSYNTVSGNSIINHPGTGIRIRYGLRNQALDNTISRNYIMNNSAGISIGSGAFYHHISENSLVNNSIGIEFSWAENRIYHNNFVNNTKQVSTWDEDSYNFWDNGYPSGGNYWSDYSDSDSYYGPYQNETGNDGIGDTPYFINENNQDNYPLIIPWGTQLPVASFFHSEQPIKNETVSFDASSSNDRDGSITSYKWNFGDGNVTSVTTPIIKHVYATQGAYTVNLTVTDNNELMHSRTKIVTVKLFRSNITLDAYPTDPLVGSNVTVNGTITPARAGVNVTISYRPSEGVWTTLATVQTNLDGSYTYTWKTTYVSTYEVRAEWTGDEDTWSAESETKTISVQDYTICITADGSVNPSTTLIQRYADVYTFTDNVYAHIVVERDNITIKGDGYILQGSGSGSGFYLSGVKNVTIKDANITLFENGVVFDNSSFNTFSGNTLIGNNWYGVTLHSSSDHNTISGNTVVANRYGISLTSSYNTVVGNNITNSDSGISISGYASDNMISGNNLTDNYNGIVLWYAFNNTVYMNTMANNNIGFWIGRSSYNTAFENVISINMIGILPEESYNNTIFHNSILNNSMQVRDYYWDFPQYYDPSINFWDGGYPGGGNYWSDYIGVDSSVGIFQNETGSDGIGDTPYVIDANNQDNYPLVNHWNPSSPIVYFTYSPKFPSANETIIFNASASYDYDGYIVSYEWNFGDGNTTTVVDQIIMHVYPTQGIYLANLTITDDTGVSRSITRSIAVATDITPPTTLHDYDGFWHTSDFIINLNATDGMSGVAEIYYRINDGPIQNITANGQPLMNTEGANNKLEYWSVDNADNEELPHKILTEIKLDKTAPSIDVPSREPEGNVLPSQSVKVSTNVTDFTSGVKNVTLYYTTNDGETSTNSPMNHTMASLYETTIPPQEAGTWVRFKIIVYDNARNNATLDGTEPYCIYQVIPEFTPATILVLFMVISVFVIVLTSGGWRRWVRK